MKIGYARVSRGEQNLDLQLDALSECDEIFTEVASRSSKDREELDKAIARLREGDSLVVWKLDRFGGNVSHVVRCLEAIRDRGANLVSLVEQLDSSTPQGKAFLQMNAIYAELEVNWIRQRTRAGMAAARARGRVGGRRRSISDRVVSEARDLRKAGYSVMQICGFLSISKGSYYRYCFTDHHGVTFRSSSNV